MRDNPNCILKETELCEKMGGECGKCHLGSMEREQQEKLRSAYEERKPEPEAQPQKKAGKEDCLMRDTEICKRVNAQCEKCDIRRFKPAMQEKMLNTYNTILRLLPKGGLKPLSDSETCLLCKDGEHRKKTCYATFDMAHEEPKGTKRMVIGLKVKQKVGSLVTVSVACCRRCHTLHIVRDMIFAGTALVFTVVGLLALLVDPMRNWLNGGGPDMLMPFIWCAAFVAAGLVIGYFAKRAATRAFSKSVSMDMFEIPAIQEMRDKGWFMMSEGDGKQRVLFLRKPERNLLPATAMDDEITV